MTPESWRKVVRVKVQGARNLDRACRKFSDQISTFVCFSSIVAAFGNAGQSSYGYANSAVDNICRERVKEGLPATSIQWGLINVGMGVSIKQVTEKMKDQTNLGSNIDKYEHLPALRILATYSSATTLSHPLLTHVRHQVLYHNHNIPL